jgi:hypothetical protein
MVRIGVGIQHSGPSWAKSFGRLDATSERHGPGLRGWCRQVLPTLFAVRDRVVGFMASTPTKSTA